MRLLSSLIALVMLATACGSDGSVDLAAELAEAEQEIVALEKIRDELAAAKEEKETLIDLLDDSTEYVEKVPAWGPESGIGPSFGPCGIFHLNGTRVVELDYDGEINPDTYYPASRSTIYLNDWIDIGVNITSFENADGAVQGHQPEQVATFRLLPGQNHVWFMSWNSFLESGHNNDAGFFALDSDCNWGWIPILPGSDAAENDATSGEGVPLVMNGSISLRRGDSGEAELHEFSYKDWSCWDYGPLYASAVYDPERHMFVSECPEG